jgi:hypothetical protein
MFNNYITRLVKKAKETFFLGIYRVMDLFHVFYKRVLFVLNSIRSRTFDIINFDVTIILL